MGEDKIGLWCAQHRFLTRAGWPFDLVFLAEEGGDYRRPLLTAVREALRALGAESALGARGGVHLVDHGEGFPTVLAWASARLPLELMEEEPEHWTPPPAVSVRPEPAPWHFDQAGSVVIRAGERLPPVGWSQILCGESFGWLTDETGNGLLWRENAHEGRLTRWKTAPPVSYTHLDVYKRQPMDEPHLSRYGANAARALELEGAVRPGTVAREMRRALAEVERARQELARWAEESLSLIHI